MEQLVFSYQVYVLDAIDAVCTDVIEVMFLCQMLSVASYAGRCPASVDRRRDVGSGQLYDRTRTALGADLILLRFTAVDKFICIGANDARVRLKPLVSSSAFFSNLPLSICLSLYPSLHPSLPLPRGWNKL